jgi:hypothetical protein
MGAIKRTPADIAFSKCIRERSGWTCERCDTFYPEGKRQALHCSHFHGRGKWSVRFDPNNAFTHCYGCHQYLGSRPLEFTAWAVDKLGSTFFEILTERAGDTNLGRRAKREAKQIAKYYRDQHANMLTQRDLGITGRIAVVGYF